MRTPTESDRGEPGGGGWSGQPSPLEQTIRTLWKRRVAFALAFLSTLAAVALVTLLLPKVYSTRAYILVEPAEGQGQFGGVELTTTLAKTYSELLQAPSMVDRVVDELSFEADPGEVADSVEVEPVTDTQLLGVEAEAGDPQRARVLANTYASVFVQRVQELNEGEAASADLRVAEFAALPGSPSRPNPRLYLLIGTLLALGVATAFVLLRARLAQSLEVDESTTRILGRPVIGRIPAMRAAGDALSDPTSMEGRMASEPFRLLHTNLTFVTSNQRPLSVAIVSGEGGEGKSICAASLARIANETDKSVLLVDGDMRKGTLTRRLVGETDDGLSSILAGTVATNRFANLVVALDERLGFLPAGRLPPNPGALLGSDALWRFDSHARSEHDLVIYDCPPMTIGADASLIASQANGVIVVVDAERTRRRSAVQALDQLERTSAEIFGIVLNRAPGGDRDYGYYYASATAPPMGEDAGRAVGRARRPTQPVAYGATRGEPGRRAANRP